MPDHFVVVGGSIDQLLSMSLNVHIKLDKDTLKMIIQIFNVQNFIL